MGRIVLCLKNEKAQIPLYVEIAGLNLYSMEELSYFLQHFLYLIDDSFFNDKLLQFLSEEMKRPELAAFVKRRKNQIAPIYLAEELAVQIGDMSQSEKEKLKKKVGEYHRISATGRKKLQADNFFEKQEYDKAADIYLQLLSEIGADEVGNYKLSRTEAGMIFHNLGKIYIKAFRWKDAGDALVMAYEYLQQDSILQELYELSCVSPVPVCDPSVFSDVHRITLRNWQENFNRKKEQAEKKLLTETIFNDSQKNFSEKKEEADRLCQKWKRDFRKIRKICCQGKFFSV